MKLYDKISDWHTEGCTAGLLAPAASSTSPGQTESTEEGGAGTSHRNPICKVGPGPKIPESSL